MFKLKRKIRKVLFVIVIAKCRCKQLSLLRMFTHFTKEEKAVHYPADRRAFMTIKPYMLIIFGVII